MIVALLDIVGPAEVDVRWLADEVFGRGRTGKTG
jgi:chromosome partitioning protein